LISFAGSTSGTSPEYHVFKKQYSSLVNTLKTTDLYRYFVSEEIITLAENDEISAESNPNKKVEVLLRKVSSPLESGLTKSFYMMLEVMASYGNTATKELARKVNEMLQRSSVSDHGKICTMDVIASYTCASIKFWDVRI